MHSTSCGSSPSAPPSSLAASLSLSLRLLMRKSSGPSSILLFPFPAFPPSLLRTRSRFSDPSPKVRLTSIMTRRWQPGSSQRSRPSAAAPPCVTAMVRLFAVGIERLLSTSRV